jgi:hypothetical protein
MIKEAMNLHAQSVERVWATDRTQSVGASEVGQCARKVFYLKNEGDPVYGAPRNPDYVDGWGAKVRGTIYENAWWEPALRTAYGERLLFAGPDQRTFRSGYLSATPDGLLIGETDNDAPILLECKTADPRTNLLEAKPEHTYQVQVQIGLIRELTNHRPVKGLISYTDTSFWDEVKEFEVTFEPEIFAHAKQRATMIMTARNAEELKPEGIISGGRECDYCPFTRACGQARFDKVPDSTDAVDAEAQEQIGELARRIKARKAVAEAAAEETKELEHELREMLAGAGTRKVAGNDFSVSWAALKGRPSWDMKGLREAAAAAGVDLSLFETAGDPTDRLTISIKS